MKYVKLEQGVMWEESMLDIITVSTSSAIFSIVLTATSEFKVCNLSVEMDVGNVMRIAEVSKRNVRKKGKLISVYLSNSKVWVVFFISARS